MQSYKKQVGTENSLKKKNTKSFERCHLATAYAPRTNNHSPKALRIRFGEKTSLYKIILPCRAVYDLICPGIWAIPQYFLQLEHPRLDATNHATGDQIEPSSAVENIFETMFFCRGNAEAEDKDEGIVDVVRPVPERVAQFPTHPGPGDYAMHPKL